jgi:hypothetical protein
MNTHMKKYLVVAVAALGISSKAIAANTGTADATITVTPVANVSMALTPSSYNFGNLDVNTSSISAVPMNLANTGDVSISVTKQVPSDAGVFVADVASTTANHYVLYVATSTSRPGAVSAFSDTDHRIGKAVANTGAASALKGLGGSTPNMTVSGGALPDVDLWYRLDMPTSVTTSAAQTITVRFTGTAL